MCSALHALIVTYTNICCCIHSSHVQNRSPGDKTIPCSMRQREQAGWHIASCDTQPGLMAQMTHPVLVAQAPTQKRDERGPAPGSELPILLLLPPPMDTAALGFFWSPHGVPTVLPHSRGSQNSLPLLCHPSARCSARRGRAQSSLGAPKSVSQPQSSTDRLASTAQQFQDMASILIKPN